MLGRSITLSGNTYTNQITASEVSVGIEQLLVAPYGTSWSPGRIDIANPPAGYYNLGSVVEDSPMLKVTRGKFQLFTGIPEVLQFESVMKMSGEFSVSLHSNSWTKFTYVVGNYTYTDTTVSLGYVRQALGTSQIVYYALLGVADFINGSQVVHWMQRATTSGDMEEKINPKSDEILAIKFDLYGYITQGVYSTCQELIVAERFYIPTNGTCTGS